MSPRPLVSPLPAVPARDERPAHAIDRRPLLFAWHGCMQAFRAHAYEWRGWVGAGAGCSRCRAHHITSSAPHAATCNLVHQRAASRICPEQVLALTSASGVTSQITENASRSTSALQRQVGGMKAHSLHDYPGREHGQQPAACSANHSIITHTCPHCPNQVRKAIPVQPDHARWPLLLPNSQPPSPVCQLSASPPGAQSSGTKSATEASQPAEPSPQRANVFSERLGQHIDAPLHQVHRGGPAEAVRQSWVWVGEWVHGRWVDVQTRARRRET